MEDMVKSTLTAVNQSQLESNPHIGMATFSYGRGSLVVVFVVFGDGLASEFKQRENVIFKDRGRVGILGFADFANF